MNGTSGIDIVLRLIQTILARKRLILYVTGASTLLAVLIVLLSDSVYKAEALVNPPQSDKSAPMGALQDLASGNMGGVFGSLLGHESGLDDCKKILGSTRFSDLMINRFDLETRYKFKKPGKNKKYFHSDVLKKFHKNFAFDDTEEGAIELSMKDTSAEDAREMVAYAIYALDSLYTYIQREALQRKLGYVDQRLAMAEADARTLEDSMVAFQKRNNIVSPEAQAKLVLQSAAETEVRKGILEEEMALEANMGGTSSPKYRDLRVQRQMVERTLRKQVDGQDDPTTLMPPTRTLPLLLVEYYRMERAYTIRLGVYKFLVQQAEMLRMDAEKNIQVISVLDPPWTNNKRVSPKRRVIVEATFILSFLISVGFVLLQAAWERQRKHNPETDRLVAQIKSSLKRF